MDGGREKLYSEGRLMAIGEPDAAQWHVFPP
jgi:hypothetical protein